MKTKEKESIYFCSEKDLEKASLERSFLNFLEQGLAKDRKTVTELDTYLALSKSIKDQIMRNWLKTQHKYRDKKIKKVYYLSFEFLMGRLLGNTLINLEYYEECSVILNRIGLNLEEIRNIEPDMGLGNGGLGRLAACFLDSCATMEYPVHGFGIRYKYGMFKQDFKNGYQIEKPDNWLKYKNPWEIVRPEYTFEINFFGKSERRISKNGTEQYKWTDTEKILAVAYDIPIPGYKTKTINNLRLWQARSTDEFDLNYFNTGDYLAAVESKSISENISKVLYPNDNVEVGKELRLKQQYFFVSATLQNIVLDYCRKNTSFDDFPNQVCIHLNDTHPAIAIPELMRILTDEKELDWTEAWKITSKVFAYTNHTILSEALEKWSVPLLENILPRHLQIIYKINHFFLESAFADEQRIRELSIIEESDPKRIRMANLSIIGSFSVNGVSELHTKILKNDIFSHFYDLNNNKFNNKTNGITQRRWLKKANPILSKLISDNIGEKWIIDLNELKKIKKNSENPDFRRSWGEAKLLNKMVLSKYISELNNINVDYNSLFDVHIKRFHEYKRQLLNVLHIITLYNRIKENPSKKRVPVTKIIGGKAAPGYLRCKLIIKLINSIADKINSDPQVNKYLKLVFIKNYSVSIAEKIIPASDLSEQISTAGYEASGTGNMKFALNGALTICTLDGANIELMKEIGEDNIFIFGHNHKSIKDLQKKKYKPIDYYNSDNELRSSLDLINTGYFNKDNPDLFKEICNDLLYFDGYFVMADYRSYIDKQDEVYKLYADKDNWLKVSINNVSGCGKFSSDRTIKEYAEDIWNIKRVKID
jgi:starch phosphorylase